MKRIAIIIGTCSGITDKQIMKLNSAGYYNSEDIYEKKDVALFVLTESKWIKTKSAEFIYNLSWYDFLIMSGGETAYSVLSSSNFDYLLSSHQYLPLISTGIIKGGILNNKKYILKGGSLGNENIYLDLIEHINSI